MEKMDLSNRVTYLVAFFLLAAMFFAAFFSLKQDSLTFDELAHIPAGYSYLTEKDYRLNPEHPPLVKDLAAVPLLFLDLNFPSNNTNWTQDDGPPPWWKQFNVGTEFLYRSGNDPQQIIFWSRLPMLALTLFLGLFLFFWTRKYLGNWAGLGALALFTFSPTFLAHGRLVTTDIGAAVGVTIAIYYWLEFLKNPASKPKLIAVIIAFGLAMLLKFTVVLLIPFFGLITILYVFLNFSSHRIRQLIKYSTLSIIVGLAALVFIIAPVYQLHIQNYPPERQARDTASDMTPGGVQIYEEILAINPADSPILRPFAQYFRGILMATQRGQFGNTVYFNENIKAGAFLAYFPTIYFTKVPIGLHLLSIIALAGLFWSLPYVHQWGVQVNVDMLAVVLNASAFLMYLHFVDSSFKKKKILGIGLVLSYLAFFAKTSAISAPGALFIYLLFRRRLRLAFGFVSILGGITACTYFGLNIATDGQ
ncbi:glycosyltransferase family 39 protein, partial [Patescibacteria group bacterium]|nr:glycosyltransferase family 39 protein [Patescibacteria group bacterium]